MAIRFVVVVAPIPTHARTSIRQHQHRAYRYLRTISSQLINSSIITSSLTMCEYRGLQTGVLSRKNSNFTFADNSLSPHDIFQFIRIRTARDYRCDRCPGRPEHDSRRRGTHSSGLEAKNALHNYRIYLANAASSRATNTVTGCWWITASIAITLIT